MAIGVNRPTVGATTINRRAVGVFSSRREAEIALQELRESGYTMDRVSIIAKDADNIDTSSGAEVRDSAGNHAGEGAAKGALTGGGLGALGGLLVGAGLLAIPGIGPVMMAGATATTIATTLSGTAIGAVAGGLIGALIGLGIPEERARVYNERVVRGHYLVIVDGTDADIRRAEAILHGRGIEEWGVYNIPGVDATDIDRSTSVDYRSTDVDYPTTTTTTTPQSTVTPGDDMVTIIDRRDDVR